MNNLTPSDILLRYFQISETLLIPSLPIVTLISYFESTEDFKRHLDVVIKFNHISKEMVRSMVAFLSSKDLMIQKLQSQNNLLVLLDSREQFPNIEVGSVKGDLTLDQCKEVLPKLTPGKWLDYNLLVETGG